MTAKKHFLLGSMMFALSACGGSDGQQPQASAQAPTSTVNPPAVASYVNLAGVLASNKTTQIQILGENTASRGAVGSAIANSQATIGFTQTETVQGNVSFLLNARDPDGISEINLVLPGVNKSLPICSSDCGNEYERSVIGLSPSIYGVSAGELRLEIWITDTLQNQVLADAITFSWQPHQIVGVTAQREDQGINLAWQANNELNRYNVYIATQPGVSPSNVDELENGQQFLSISDPFFTIPNTITNKSYQALITGIDGSGESGFSNLINIAPLGGELAFAPTANNDIFEIDEDTALQGNVLTNDTNPYSGQLLANTQVLVTPSHGSVTMTESGDFTYQPALNFNGEDAFSYQIINELGRTDTAVVAITINPINDAPTALNNTYNISSDGTLTVSAPGLLGNDSDVDLDELTVDVAPVNEPLRGQLTLFADGSFEYQGEPNMQGEDSFQYKVIDNQGGEATATVFIVSTNTNSAPVANNDSYNVNEDNTLVISAENGVLSNDTDPNGDTFTVDDTFIVAPTHGQLLLSIDGSFSYIPDANFNGVDQFQYAAIDSQGASAAATVTIIVNSQPDNPVAQNDAYQFNRNSLFSVSAESGLLANDFNIETGELTVNTTPVTAPQNGTLNLNSDGSFTYQPNADFSGVDSFSYSISNEQGLTATAQVTLSESGNNTFPEASDDQFTIAEDSSATQLNVLANDTDADGDTITLFNVNSTLGSASIVNGQIEYTPPANFSGQTVLTYSITDGYENGSPGEKDSTASVTIIVTPVNDAPVANADLATINEDAIALLIDVLANDSDIDGDSLILSEVSADSGTALIVENQIQYAPAPDANGVATVTYSIKDAQDANATSTLSITILPINDAPFATADTATMDEDAAPITIDVLANDSDVDGDSLVISNASADVGTATILNNQIQYTPAANANGVATVNYTANDNNGGTASSTLAITINPINDAPVATADTATMDEDAAPITIDVLANDSDVDGDSLVISNATADVGAVSVVNNQIQYTPAANANGVATVIYTATDNNGGTASSTLAITINPINDVPVATADTATMDEDAAPITIDVLANDSDVDGDSLVISNASADVGTATILNNQIQYTPAANTNGVATVAYTASDNNGGTANSTLAITINPVNDAPIVAEQSFSINEDATDSDIIGTIVATDHENQDLTYVLAGGDFALFNINASSGILSVNGETPFDYETKTQYILNIQVTDNGTPNETTAVNITVNITDVVEPLIPVEDTSFGRPITGQLDLGSVFSGGQFNDSIALNNNLYFVGFTNNADKDILIVSYTNNGDVNTAFNTTGTKVLDLEQDEKATAIISDGTDLFIAYSSFDGSNNEACVLKMDLAGALRTGSDDDDDDGESNTGIKCTTLNNTTVINDLEIDGNKLLAVGKHFDGTQTDSLWIHYKTDDLSFENSTPTIVDVSGANRDDEGYAVKNFENSDYLVVGSVTDADGTKNSLLRYLKSNGNNDNDFNGGASLTIDLSGNDKDDELFAIGGLADSNFTAFAGGYVTRNSGEKEAVVLAIDKNGELVTSFDTDGIAIYDIDGNSGAGNGGAQVTGIQYEPIKNEIMLSGTTGVPNAEYVFTARVISSTSLLDDTYGESGVSILSDIDAKQIVNTTSIDSNDTLWVAGIDDDTNAKPFIGAITDQAALFTNFNSTGYLTLDEITEASNDQSMKLIQLSNGAQAGKYMLASTAETNGVIKLVLTRFTSTGAIDTGFSDAGHKEIAIELNSQHVALAELNNGNLLLAGTKKTTNGSQGFVAKVDQGGSLDTTFATDGIYVTNIENTEALTLSDIAITNSNNIVAVGTATQSANAQSFAMMLTAQGVLATSFGTEGVLLGLTDEGFSKIHIDSNEIFIAGELVTGADSALIALKLNLTGNELFRYSGTDTPNINNKVASVLTDSSGAIYLVANLVGTPDKANVVRLLSSGSLDTSFADNGVGQYSLAATGNTLIKGAKLDSTDKLILVGTSNNEGVIARITTNGELDSTFGNSGVGYYQANLCTNSLVFSSLIIQTDTQIALSSTCDNGSSNNISVSKFDFYPDGVEP
ncbi:Ig-like domain-containing protein [Pseudoalteromonas marina]|uniref:Ig-like domain-containing protein n=1 Tax=Pseudoalteromonas marina TaxID=267375 RepID=UPI0027334464|nr:tandem-95 repeat protein [Pseudoalteromonas marina]MDP2485964.1 tandem-95 repeat protein [Pseudoalteromonas marina]